jgi:putative transposase
MGWVSRKEYCEKENISHQAYKKRKAKGLIQWRYGASGRGGEAGKRIEIWIEDPDGEIGRSGDGEKKLKEKDYLRIHRGEPGCHIVTPIINGLPAPPSETTSLVPPQGEPTPDGGAENFDGREEGSVIVMGSLKAHTTRTAVEAITRPSIISPQSLRIANLRFALIQKFNEEISKEYPTTLPLFKNGNNGNGHSKTKAIQKFLDLYNSGLLLPDIHKELKEISRSTLYNWLSAQGPDDLIPQYGGAGQSKITDHEKNLLLTLLLHQNRIKTAYAIALAKEYLIKKHLESPSSPATLRRFVNQFKKEHYDLWILRREGEKALNDKVLPYAERDWRLLEVGDGLVADGHRLNFQIVHPITGKPCRATLVLFWDWRSSYPLGWEIMIEENIQCVASALRNAILALGKIPQWVLLDNGKAFKAKIFTEDINFEDTELPGMFARLNINYHFAQPYNAQSKPIERIFGIINEQLERLIPSYTGASIEDKPAYTKRNEKLARSAHNSWVPTIQETNDFIRAWRDRYAERPTRGRDGLRPIDIYNDGKGPGVDPLELIYLMMDREIKNVHRNGVTWMGWNWYHEDLYGLKDKVIIRYSLSDLSQIYVFHKNEFLCAAKPIEPVHPMASESENPKDMEAVKEVYRLKNKVKNTTRKLCDLLDSKSAAQIDWSRTKTQEISETIQKIEETKKPRVIRFSPFVNSEDDKAATSVPARADELPSNVEQAARPRFQYDYEKYDWLMAQDSIAKEDQKWIDQYRLTSSLHKHALGGNQ